MNHRKIGQAAIYMAAAEAVASTGAPASAPATAGPAPDSNVAGAEKAKRAPRNPDNILNIINGRLPIVLVYLIRFKEVGATVAASAKKYGTSVGKVFDINKNRNFAYVDASYKPSAEEVAAGMAWCETGKTAKGQTLKEAGGDPDAIKAAIGALGVATAEEVAARNWQIKQVGVKATGAAPVAGATDGAAAGKPAEAAKGGAKLF